MATKFTKHIINFPNMAYWLLSSLIPETIRVVPKYTTLDISLFIAEVERYDVPDRPASAFWNAAVKCLQNNGWIKNYDDVEKTIVTKLTVDRYKIKRGKENCQETIGKANRWWTPVSWYRWKTWRGQRWGMATFSRWWRPGRSGFPLTTRGTTKSVNSEINSVFL